jgi:hypothetical protein
MMQPISGLTEFLALLSRLERGEAGGFPIYCALLFTTEGGLDERIAHFVADHWWELDDMTADDCLVFVVGDRDQEQVVGGRRLVPSEIYSVARELGARADVLPCACFFVEPASSRDVLRLRLRDYIPGADPPAEDDLTRAFRAVGSALQTCATRPADQRLDCLRAELTHQHERLVGDRGSTGGPAQSLGRAERVLASGASVAASIATVLGIVL